MYYHCAILLLFWPFINCSHAHTIPPPRDICVEAAENIAALLCSYRELYTVRSTPTFMPCIILNAGISHLVGANVSAGSSSILQSLNDLKDMSVCHRFAEHSIDILLFFAHRWNKFLHHEPATFRGSSIDARELYHPLCSSLSLFHPSGEIHSVLAADPTMGMVSSYMVLRQYLFSPFPNQGLPLLPAMILSVR